MRLGYNTNGFPHHRLEDAIEIIAEIGYQSVALTLDHGSLNPYEQRLAHHVARVRRQLESLGLTSVIETGARFLLDPRRKHEPTLMSADPAGRQRRIDFLLRALDIAADLGADAVSLWSGRLDEPLTTEEAFDRLISGLEPVLQYAERVDVPLAFEPEPGMWIDTLERFAELRRRLDHPLLGLTMDIGHVHCQEEGAIPACIHQWAQHLLNIHIEDMKRGVHEHLMFGEGEIVFPPILDALAAVGYTGGVHVELSRHGHAVPEVAREAWEFLQRAARTDREDEVWPTA